MNKKISKSIFSCCVWFVATFLTAISGEAQPEWKITLDPLEIESMPALQSFVAAQYDGKWLLIGGRTDGLHRRQPPFAFLDEDNNRNMYVIDPGKGKVWSQSSQNLPQELADQLRSTNMEYYIQGSQLYIVGGYGYSIAASRHITFPAMVIVDVPGLMQAVMKQENLQPYFTRIYNEYFAITGGQMGMLGDTLLLAGGKRFDGRYNPHNMPSFTQQYSNEIRRFMVKGQGATATIQYFESLKDEKELHRRDYNMLPQIFPGQKQGYTLFSGVFQYHADIPFLNTVDVFSNAYTPRQTFEQRLNHYHSGKLAMHDSAAQMMYNIFMGGMAQYFYDSTNTLVKMDNVPFVSTIGCITRNGTGEMQEYKMGDMPGLLGAGAEFFTHVAVPQYDNGVIKYHALPAGKNFVGWLYGGLESTAPIIFFSNSGSQSRAVNKLFKVYITK